MEAADARPSLYLSKYQIVRYLMPRLKSILNLSWVILSFDDGNQSIYWLMASCEQAFVPTMCKSLLVAGMFYPLVICAGMPPKRDHLDQALGRGKYWSSYHNVLSKVIDDFIMTCRAVHLNALIG